MVPTQANPTEIVGDLISPSVLKKYTSIMEKKSGHLEGLNLFKENDMVMLSSSNKFFFVISIVLDQPF